MNDFDSCKLYRSYMRKPVIHFSSLRINAFITFDGTPYTHNSTRPPVGRIELTLYYDRQDAIKFIKLFERIDGS